MVEALYCCRYSTTTTTPHHILFSTFSSKTTIIIPSSLPPHYRHPTSSTYYNTSTRGGIRTAQYHHHHHFKISAAAASSSSLSPTQHPKHHLSFLESLFNSFDALINTSIDPTPLLPTIDPAHVLSGNYLPVDELPPTDCQVIQGSLPSCLDGAYIRNGPNPSFTPRGPHHFFDGDGMLHSVRISKGRATFCSRYVKTYKYVTEQTAGYPLVPNIFSGFSCLAASVARAALFAARIMAGQYHPKNGIGLANTSVAFFRDKLYALCESDLPYAIKVGSDGDVITLVRDDFDGQINTINMTAHPKSDPETNETFAFQYCAVRPFLTFLRFDANGKKQDDIPIFSMKHPSLVHDLAITKKYAIFVEIQIGVKPMGLVRGGSSLLGVDEGVPRIGIIPRDAKDESEIQWFDAPGLNNLHIVNAWEEKDENDETTAVVMVAPNILEVGHFLERMDLMHIQMEKIRIDLKTGTVMRDALSPRSMDFAVINPAYAAKKNRYVYAGLGETKVQPSKMGRICGVAKLDVAMSSSEEECIVASRMYGEGCFGGEPFFVSSQEDGMEEDGGYIVSYVHNENTGESRFLVMDAQSPDLEIVATVRLPQRVPYGLHGLFVREHDLDHLL